MFEDNVTQVKFANWVLCTRSCSLTSVDINQELTPLSYKILCYFISNPNRIISRDEFISSVWTNHFVDDNAINKAISDLRRLLKVTDDSPNLIKTHYKKGYSFTCDVEYIYEKLSSSEELSINSVSQPISESSLTLSKSEVENSSLRLKHSQFLVGFKENKSELFNLKYFLIFIALLLTVSGATYWLYQQPETIHLKSQKLSISDNSVYSLLSLSPTNDKLAVSKLNSNNGVDEIFLIDLKTHKNTKIISESFDSYPIGWASNSNSIYYQVINNEKKICEVWRADFLVNNEVSNREKIFDCKSQYILSLAVEEASNHIIYTKYGYRNVAGLSALVARNLKTGNEYQISSPNIDSFGDRYVTLSPKKDKIAFIRFQTGLVQIFLANLDGSMQRLLYESTETIRRISWSSDAQNLSWYVSGSKELMEININSETLTYEKVSSDSYIETMVPGFNALYGASRATDDDIYLFKPIENSFKKLIDSRAREFRPISTSDGFYFFQEGEELQLYSFLDEEGLTNTGLLFNLPSFNSGDYNNDNGLLALSFDKELWLVHPQNESVIDTFSLEHQIAHLSWFNQENILLVLESNLSEQHVWMFNIKTENLQKIIHNDAKRVSKTQTGGIVYQDFYNKFYLFDPQEGTQYEVLSLSQYPYVQWKFVEGDIYFSTGKNLIQYSLETQKETVIFQDQDINERIISDFSVLKNGVSVKYILQIQSFKSNSIILLNK